MNATYKVTMTFLAEQDIYNDGCTGEIGASWHESGEFNTLDKVKEFVKDRTYSGYKYLEYDTFNKTYMTAYHTTDENCGEMSPTEYKQWKLGKINGWYTVISVRVEKFTPKTIGNIKFN